MNKLKNYNLVERDALCIAFSVPLIQTSTSLLGVTCFEISKPHAVIKCFELFVINSIQFSSVSAGQVLLESQLDPNKMRAIRLDWWRRTSPQYWWCQLKRRRRQLSVWLFDKPVLLELNAHCSVAVNRQSYPPMMLLAAVQKYRSETYANSNVDASFLLLQVCCLMKNGLRDNSVQVAVKFSRNCWKECMNFFEDIVFEED